MHDSEKTSRRPIGAAHLGERLGGGRRSPAIARVRRRWGRGSAPSVVDTLRPMADDRPLEDQVRHDVRDGVAWIVLNRPDSGNALTPDQRNRIVDLLDDANADVAIRAVVLTATAERAFCTGADLRVDRPPTHAPPAEPPHRPPPPSNRTCLGAHPPL